VKTVTLKNGAEEAEALVNVGMMMLRRMMEDTPVVFYEFVCKCRNPSHQMWGDTENKLSDFGVLDPTGHIHSSIRNITVSAVEGEDLEMRLGSPI
jgi:hypothetical protein